MPEKAERRNSAGKGLLEKGGKTVKEEIDMNGEGKERKLAMEQYIEDD